MREARSPRLRRQHCPEERARPEADSAAHPGVRHDGEGRRAAAGLRATRARSDQLERGKGEFPGSQRQENILPGKGIHVPS